MVFLPVSEYVSMKYYARSPFVSLLSQCAQSGRWSSFGKRVRFTESHIYIYIYFFFFQCHHMSFADFVVLPPGHSSSVTDFWDWDAHGAQLRCPAGVWVVIEEDVLPGGALNLNSTNLLRPWSPRESSPSRKIPTVEPEIDPGTS